MRNLLLASALTLFALGGCKFQDANSFSEDGYRAGAGGDGSAAFLEVRAILKAKCAECHLAYARFSEDDWIANRYVNPGDARNSTLYRRLRGANVGGEENMPQAGALSSSELAAFYNWIQGISVLDPSGLTAAQRTEAALNVLANRCVSCHNVDRTGQGAGHVGQIVKRFNNFTTDNDFVTNDLIVPNDVGNSWIMQSLKTWGTINTMPPAGAIPESEKLTLERWINGIGTP